MSEDEKAHMKVYAVLDHEGYAVMVFGTREMAEGYIVAEGMAEWWTVEELEARL